MESEVKDAIAMNSGKSVGQDTFPFSYPICMCTQRNKQKLENSYATPSSITESA